MRTHYAYILAGTGGSGTAEDTQRPVTMDGFSLMWQDITGTPALKMVGLEPDLILVYAEGTEAALDAANAAPGNFELARGTLDENGIRDESSLEVTLTNKDKNDLIAIFQAEIDSAVINRRTALTDYASALGVELQGMSKKQALLRLVQAINEMVDL